MWKPLLHNHRVETTPQTITLSYCQTSGTRARSTKLSSFCS